MARNLIELVWDTGKEWSTFRVEYEDAECDVPVYASVRGIGTD
ncbi:hypothetical protein [Edaphobacter bradus]|nr:hypothetical protein [Edaphobacter bradus]